MLSTADDGHPTGSLESPGDAPDALSRGASLDRYVIVSEIGAGGMGRVYEAYDPKLGRSVAIKVLHEGATGGTMAQSVGESGAAMLMQEAHSLARLAHPNVVTIFDVGRSDQRVFLTMELVRGRDLEAWLRAEARSWRSIVETFASAAEGLAAAHEQGIVHRDFKPDNVLIDDYGHPKILDFGLANAQGTPGTGGLSLTESSSASTRAGTTRAGTFIAGTPRYMAPEQHAGGFTDERCDQYAYCVSLHEALTGRRLFPSASLEELARAKDGFELGRYPVPSAPRWLAQLIARGLEPVPDDRHPSMAAIAFELRDRLSPRRRRKWISAGFGLVALAGSTVAAAAQWQSERICERESIEGAKIWNSARRATIAREFVATGIEHAATSFERAAERMDLRMARWLELSRATCELAHADSATASRHLELRRQCLDGKLDDHRVILESWTRAERGTIDQAARNLANLGPIDDCLDPETWQREASLPRDPRLRTRALALKNELLQATLASEGSRTAHARQLAHSIAQRGREIGYHRAQAEAEMLLAKLAMASLDRAMGREHATRAMLVADTGNDDWLAAKIAIEQIVARVLEGRQWHEYEQLLSHARAHVERTGDDEALRGLLARTTGDALSARRDFAAAVDEHRLALELMSRSLSPDHPDLNLTRINLAISLEELGRFDQAEPYYRRAMAEDLETLGPDHPQRIRAMFNFSIMLSRSGRLEESLTLSRESRDILARSGSDNAMRYLQVTSYHATSLAIIGRVRESIALWQDCFDHHRSITRRNDIDLLIAGNQIIALSARLGDVDAVAPLVQRLTPMIETAFGDRGSVAQAIIGHESLMRYAIARGDFDRAEELAARLKHGLKKVPPHMQLADRPPGMIESIRLAIARGECENAERILDELDRRRARTGPFADNPYRSESALLRADNAWSCGNPERAAEIYAHRQTLLRDRPAARARLLPRLRALELAARIAHLRERGREPDTATLQSLHEVRAVLDPRQIGPRERHRMGLPSAFDPHEVTQSSP